MKLEEERQALAAFVQKFDALGLGGGLALPPTKLNPPMPTPGGAAAVFAERQRNRLLAMGDADYSMATVAETESPIRVSINATSAEPSLLEEQWDALDDVSFETEKGSKFAPSPVMGKENLPV
jgi:centromeric protein E